ncbi:DUF6473 family protein [Sulfitobacter sp. LCG007]
MTYDVMGLSALQYDPCRYDGSRLVFRGPARCLDDPYAVFLGGTETYGRFIEKPFPALLEEALGVTCVNLGIPNAGIDVFATDPFVRSAANRSRVTVLQVLGAQNLSNRFYTVHPRRNDRFVSASATLRAIYKGFDFTEIHFTGHMLRELHKVSSEQFELLRLELQNAWVARMRLFIRNVPGKICLLWIGRRAPGENENLSSGPLDLTDPAFVTRSMMSAVMNERTELVEVVASPEAIAQGTEGMLFNNMESAAAKEMLGPAVHQQAAARLETTLMRLLA